MEGTVSYIFLWVSILLGAVGQLALKYSTLVTPRVFIIQKEFNEVMVGALGLYFISVILYTLALRNIPLTIAYPSVAISYIFVAFGSHLIWQTPFGLREILALFLILSGVTLLSTGVK